MLAVIKVFAPLSIRCPLWQRLCLAAWQVTECSSGVKDTQGMHSRKYLVIFADYVYILGLCKGREIISKVDEKLLKS